MFRIVVSAVVVFFFFAQSARADENFRIARPTESDTESLLGDIIYPGVRTLSQRTSFERWRQNYCAPYVCNMVLCHGTCADYAEHCPSFAESGQVIHIDNSGCMSPSNQTAESSLKGSHCLSKQK